MSELLDRLVNRFLAWPLPKTVSPDATGSEHDSGTNLLNDPEARQMFTEVVIPEIDALIKKGLIDQFMVDHMRSENNSLRKQCEKLKGALEKIAKNKTEDCEIYTMGCDCDEEAREALKEFEDWECK